MSTDRQANYYNQRRRPHDFQVGDVVLVKNIVLSKKASNIVGGLAPKRRGDYVIVRQLGDNVFEVADCNGEIVGEYQSSQLEHLVPEYTGFEGGESSTSQLPSKEKEEVTTNSPGKYVKIDKKKKKKKKGPKRKTILAPAAAPRPQEDDIGNAQSVDPQPITPTETRTRGRPKGSKNAKREIPGEASHVTDSRLTRAQAKTRGIKI